MILSTTLNQTLCDIFMLQTYIGLSQIHMLKYVLNSGNLPKKDLYRLELLNEK